MTTADPIKSQPNTSQQLLISVIGSASPSQRVARMAEEVGIELAKRKVVIVCGGLGGVMEAVCKGAKSMGGTTVGILPGDDPTDANPFVDIPLCTGLGKGRNVIVVKSGRAVIAIGGAYGTLSEIGHALSDNIPVIGLETWRLPSRNDLAKHIVLVKNAEQAANLAIAATTHPDDHQTQSN